MILNANQKQKPRSINQKPQSKLEPNAGRSKNSTAEPSFLGTCGKCHLEAAKKVLFRSWTRTNKQASQWAGLFEQVQSIIMSQLPQQFQLEGRRPALCQPLGCPDEVVGQKGERERFNQSGFLCCTYRSSSPSCTEKIRSRREGKRRR